MTASMTTLALQRGAMTRRPRSASWRELTALLLLLTTLPSLSIMILGATSFAMGLALACVIILIFRGWQGRHDPIRVRTIRSACLFALALWCAIAIHGTIASKITGFFDWPRAISSLTLVTIVLAAASALRVLIVRAKPAAIVSAMRCVFGVFVVEATLTMLGFPALGPAMHFRPVIFFMEPSQFSLGFMPFMTFAVIAERGLRRMAVIVAALIVGLLLQSLTLLVGLGLIVALMLPMRRLVVSAVVVAPILLIMDTTYYVDRLTLSEDVENLSALAFLQGWERALLNIQNTYGVGVGFQQFGLVGDLGFFQERIAALFSAAVDLNLLDGGTNGSKLVGEFGMFGVASLVLYVLAVLVAVVMCKKAQSTDPILAQKQFFTACIVAAFTEIFVRGGGYMSPGMMLLAAGLLWFVPTNAITTIRRAKSPRRS